MQAMALYIDGVIYINGRTKTHLRPPFHLPTSTLIALGDAEGVERSLA